MTIDHNAIRIAEVYRLHLAGLSQDEIVYQIDTQLAEQHLPLVGAEQIATDLEMIRHWQEQYADPEAIRTSIALDLDTLFQSILIELQGNWISKQSRAKSEFYKEARETLRQKADLYGLNSSTVNVNSHSKLLSIVAELKQSATQLEAEAGYPALPESYNLSLASPAADELLVESDSADRR